MKAGGPIKGGGLGRKGLHASPQRPKFGHLSFFNHSKGCGVHLIKKTAGKGGKGGGDRKRKNERGGPDKRGMNVA